MRAIPALVSYNDPCRTGNPMRTLLWKLLLIFTWLVVALLVGLILFLAWRAPRGTWRSRLRVWTLGWLVSLASAASLFPGCGGNKGHPGGEDSGTYGGCYIGAGEYARVLEVKVEPLLPKHGDTLKISGEVQAYRQVYYSGPVEKIPVDGVTVHMNRIPGDPCPEVDEESEATLDADGWEGPYRFEADLETQGISCERVILKIEVDWLNVWTDSYKDPIIHFLDPPDTPESTDAMMDAEVTQEPEDDQASDPRPEVGETAADPGSTLDIEMP